MGNITIETPEPSFIHDDPEMQRGFTPVPNFVLRNPKLSQQARLTYAVMKSYAWGQKEEMWAGQETLASHLGVSTRQLRDYISELVTSGLVIVKHRGLGMTNQYRLTDRLHPAWRPEAPSQIGTEAPIR